MARAEGMALAVSNEDVALEAPGMDAAELAQVVLDTSEWLEGEMLVQRSDINRVVELKHRELLREFERRLASHARTMAVIAKSEEPKSEAAAVAPGNNAGGGMDSGEGPEVATKSTADENGATETTKGVVKAGSTASLEQIPNAGRLERLVNSVPFEIVFGILIFLNAFVMAIQRQYQGDITAYTYLGYKDAMPAEETWVGAEDAFAVLEWFFGLIFTTEVVLKLVSMKKRFFTDTLWNVFDLVVVTIWLIDQAAHSALQVDPTLLRMARIVRLARLLRVMRWLQIIDPLILMVKAIKASVSVLVWSLLLLLLLVSVVAMAVSALLEPWIRDEANLRQDRIAVFESWGTFARAMETMCEITLANWGPPTKLLMNTVNQWWAFAVLAYKLTIGFAVVQVIISVFIQQTFKVASRDEEVLIKEKSAAAAAYATNLKSLFRFIDKSGDGFLSQEEFEEVLLDKRVKTWFSALEVEPGEVSTLFEMLDDGDGQISMEEFMQGVKALKGFAKGTDVLMLSREVKKNFKVMSLIDGKIDLIANKLSRYEDDLSI